MSYKTLPQFARWFLAQSFSSLRPPRDAIRHYVVEGGALTAIVLHRDGQFQAEMYIALPNPSGGSFREHSHPNVDSIEYFFSGRVEFIVGGRRWQSNERLIADDDSMIGLIKRIRPSQPHSGVMDAAGASFVSLQHWLNDVQPTSVGLDWDGPRHVQVMGGN